LAAAPEALRFLLLTFTRSAKEELVSRIRNTPAFAPIAPNIEVTTLNSWGFRRIKVTAISPKLIVASQERYFALVNVVQPVWQQYEQLRTLLGDSRRRVKGARQLMDLSDQLKGLGYRHDRHTDRPSYLRHTEWLISNGMAEHVKFMMIKRLVDLEVIDQYPNLEDTLKQLFDRYFRFWCSATHALYNSALLTLEDQKYWPLISLEQSIAEGRNATGGQRYHYILVDEFQDINTLDLNLLKAIATVNRAELTIVGDDDQTIFEWRGATPSFILNPALHIGTPYSTYTLGINYRSPRNIVELSQRLIRHNVRRVDKAVRSALSTDADVQAILTPSLEHSVTYIHTLVRELLISRIYSNIAIVSRKRSQLIPFQIIFAGENIPFYAAEDLHVLLSEAFDELRGLIQIKAYAGVPALYGSDPIRGLLALCDKIRRYPLARQDRERLRAHLMSCAPTTLTDALRALSTYTDPLKGENSDGRVSEEFCACINEFLAARSVADTMYAVSENFEGLRKDYGKSLDDIFYADPPFLYLADFAHRYGEDFGRFYADVEKAAKTLALIPEGGDEAEPDPKRALPLHLMTALRAKGKEFDLVIVLDANQGIWPSKLATSDEQLEAERRLFYVAVTRARRQLLFMVNEEMFGAAASPTQYLAEMGLPLTRVVSK
jgi:DNA helicase-2/ATP-dependent DNA helicase PcrA